MLFVIILNMKTITITKAKQEFDELLNEVLMTSSPVLIKTKNGKGCYLMPESIYKGMLETLSIQSNSRTRNKIKDGEKENISLLPSYFPNEEW